ncbi:HTH-type transcriptional repressor YvoA [Ruegeria denitrificans]|uniref:HTH-type transcriptional repressor YvoA n=1 Tax=Ruegeria denitrificans TaxID=1715692 RepID=A0A0P1IKE0_9RHOB|nr:GntR family transcriptional regulator [Ruegeria denitrificans]CUK19226.1 HTH-type transcriptional repressor YvoA [Ruegeria denitrificans]
MPQSSDTTSYKDIKITVLSRIRSGEWQPDSLLPNEQDLAVEFSCTRTTVNRALRELADEGYLERRRKAGTRVLSAPQRQARFTIPMVRDEVEAMGGTYRYALVSSKLEIAPEWLSARLALSSGQNVMHVRCMHFNGNTPFQYEDRWIVPASVPQVKQADFSQIGPNEWLIQTVPFTNVELSFLASRADATIAGFLDVPEGEPVFTGERITWLQGQPVTFAKMFFAAGYRMTTQF